MSAKQDSFRKIYEAKKADPNYNISAALRKAGATPTSYYFWVKKHAEPKLALADAKDKPNAKALSKPAKPALKTSADDPHVEIRIPISQVIDAWKSGKTPIQVTWSWLERAMTDHHKNELHKRIGELVVNQPPIKKTEPATVELEDGNGHDIVD